VLDKIDYENKIYSLSNDSTTYSAIKRDPTKNIEHKLNKFTF